MKPVLLLICGIFLFSCKSENKTDRLVDISVSTWIIDNQELKSMLSEYIQTVAKDSIRENSFVQMSYRVINDTTCSYVLSTSSDINSFIYSVPQIMFQFKGKLICCFINGLDIFRINDDFLVEFMKENYPDQYNYYLKTGDYPPPITGGGLEWELIFQNDHLICKEEYYSQ